jgi:SAM-dependent methyltransferase
VTTRETFDEGLEALARSPCFRQHNLRVHGDELRFGMVDGAELPTVLRAAALGPADRFVDLGCAWGALTAKIASLSGARGLGLDIAGSAVARATRAYADRGDLEFAAGDLDDLRLPPRGFRAAIAADTLYFCRDLAATLRAVGEALTPGGRLVVAWTSRDAVVLETSRLGRALRDTGYAVISAHDASDTACAFWRRSVASCEALRERWTVEDPARFEALLGEARGALAALEAGEARRWIVEAAPR